ncbi:MAG TPA: DUF2795 domain-containing protein [Candidatus Saccharimonadia bacterium]|nr:DUF2795 domain-containing protein [Candidatus Saccharimonadia bacterium]
MASKDNTSKEKLSGDQIEEHLEGASYPADRDHLVQTAKRNDAPRHVVMFLEQIPPDRTFNKPGEITELLIIDTDEAYDTKD